MVRLLESVVRLRDEGGGPLDALFATGYLLGQLPQSHRLSRKQDNMKSLVNKSICFQPTVRGTNLPDVRFDLPHQLENPTGEKCNLSL